MAAKVSIIIPAYKTEEYLPECVDSVLMQDHPDLEVILVDDGSPDGCPEICDRYARAHKNVHVIHQYNRGAGPSRDAGLDVASGDYVMFMDSDDCLDGPCAVSILAWKAESSGADIVIGSFRRIGPDGAGSVNRHHLRGGAYARTAEFRFKGFYQYGHLAYDWGKLYSRSFLQGNNIRCGSYPFTQDKAHNMACYACRPVYAFLDESVYLYRVNTGSVTFRYKKDFIPVWTSIASDFCQFLKDRGITEDYGDLAAFHIFFGSFFLAKQELQAGHGISGTAKALREYGSDPSVRCNMAMLAKGRHMEGVGPLSWRMAIRAASALFGMKLYRPYAAGIAFLRMLRVDRGVTRSRYKRNILDGREVRHGKNISHHPDI